MRWRGSVSVDLLAVVLPHTRTSAALAVMMVARVMDNRSLHVKRLQ